MIITKEVQEILDVYKKTGGDELVESATAILKVIEDTLGSNPDRWYGAMLTEGYWVMWFKTVVAAWPGGMEAAYDFLPGVDAVHLIDVFIQSHPMAELAMTKFGPFGTPADREGLAPEDAENAKTSMVNLFRDKMAGKRPDQKQVVEIEGEEADQLLSILGLAIKDGKLVDAEGKEV